MDTYIKNHSEQLDFYEILQLLTQMKEQDLLHSDPEYKDNILIYREAGENGDPEGWYSENIFSVAEELKDDYESQQSLWRILEEHSFEPYFEPKWWNETSAEKEIKPKKKQSDIER